MLSLFLGVAAAGDRLTMEPDVRVGSSYDWHKVSKSLPSEKVNLLLMMKHQPAKMVELEETFWAVSDPKNARYGQHLSRNQVSGLLAPATGNVEKVVNWLKQAGTVDISQPNVDMIDVSVDVSTAETLLETTFYNFKHTDGFHTLVRATEQYSLPVEIADAVSIVGNVLQFPRIDTPILVPANNTSDKVGAWPESCQSKCKEFVTPAVLAERYSTGTPPNVSAPKNTMATAEFQGQGWDQKDLDTFSNTCGLQKMTVDKSIGTSPTSAGIEAMLDIEYINAVGGAIPLTNVYSAQYSLLDWAKQLGALGDGNIPLINSVSYGNDEKQQSGVAYMDSCNDQFKALGARGVSILFASGDQGVCGREGCGIFGKEAFHPDFPGGSPYITVVGGTDFATRSTIGDEMAWKAGGGGFSNTFGIPDYQADVVAAYKEASKAAGNLPDQKLWNNTGRGYPDIAALGGQVNPYCIVSGGRFAGVAGTSAACPVAAATFALVNDALLTAGKPPLGFLNPFIYQNGAAFNDVTSGSNPGAGKIGFSALKGWDPATGFGTPNVQKMKAAAMAIYE